MILLLGNIIWMESQSITIVNQGPASVQLRQYVDNFETSQCDPEQLIERNFYDIMKINDVARSLKCDYF